MVFDHIGFNVTDFAKAREFFVRALEPLGIVAPCAHALNPNPLP